MVNKLSNLFVSKDLTKTAEISGEEALNFFLNSVGRNLKKFESSRFRYKIRTFGPDKSAKQVDIRVHYMPNSIKGSLFKGPHVDFIGMSNGKEFTFMVDFELAQGTEYPGVIYNYNFPDIPLQKATQELIEKESVKLVKDFYNFLEEDLDEREE